MKVHMDDRQRSIARTAVWIFTICLTIGIAVWRWSSLVAVFRKIVSVMAPVLVGLVLAYLMSPLQNWLEIRIGRFTDKNMPHPRLKRALSVTGAILVLLIAIFGLVAAIVPELITSIKNLLVSLPEYLTNMTDWINAHIASLKDDQPQLYSVLTNIWDTALNSANNFAVQFEPKLDSIASGGADVISTLTSGAVSVFKWLTNFLLGIIITIYLLYNKEIYIAQVRKLLYAILPEKNVHTFLEIGTHVSYKFMHFLSGKTLDSLIIGLLCFTGMTILNMPYTTLISILVGVTNIIPFFGPIIGAVPSALLILLSEPRKLIPFVIFILVLQQFDGNFLGPKILGDSLGLPMFWTLFAITVGGGIFGFIGMVAFVPRFAAVYTLFSDFLSEQLHKKGLPAETANYMTNEIHYASPPQKSDIPMPSDEDDQPKMPEVPDDEEDYVPVPVEEIADRAESSDQSE